MSRIKLISLVCLAIFALMQVSACFVAGCNTDGFVSVFFFVLGGVSCLFGMVLDFLLLIIAVDVFSKVFGDLAAGLAKKQSEEEEEEEEMEVVDTPE